MRKWLNLPYNRVRPALTMRRVMTTIGALLLLWLVVILALTVTVYTFGETNGAQSADVAIILGSGLRRDGRPGDALYRRSVWGAELYHEGLIPAIICTGGVGRGHTRSEADACRETLIDQGVPESVIYLEELSHSTEENAIFAREIMEAQGWETAVVVTDSFHMFRANWIFNNQGITHHPSPVPRDRVRWYFYTQHFAREILAIHWQAFKEVFNLPVTSINL